VTVNAWRALGAFICLVSAAVMCALLIGLAWAVAPWIAQALR
jgi:hypothetical protein